MPNPGTFRYATVKPQNNPGSTLKSLSRIYYGNENRWLDIYNANRTGIRRSDGTPGVISNPNVLHVGLKLIIPN